MALFGRNPNESAYYQGHKHWVDVIKNTGPSDMIVWRQPEEDFNTNSTLIVMPGEVAIFVKGGVIEAVFENNTYKLSTQNYPIISRLRNSLTGGISTFNCVVYFVRMADTHEIRWGTDSPIQLRDKQWGILTNAKVRAVYKLHVENPSLFLEKLIGSKVRYNSQNDLNEYFAGTLQGMIKSAVSKFLNSLTCELIGIEEYIDELSDKIRPYIDDVVKDYGLSCVRFTIAGLDVDTSKYEFIDQSKVNAIKTTIDSEGERNMFNNLGENYYRRRSYDIADTVAQNTRINSTGINFGAAANAPGMIGASMLGSMMGQAFSGLQQQTFSPAPQPVSQPAPQPTPQPTPQPAADSNASGVNDPIQVLKTLKAMLDAGLIEQSEYDEKKRSILSRM